MQKFLKSGGAFFLLSIAFMSVAVISERPAVYISLGAFWLLLGFAMSSKHNKASSSQQQKDSA